MATVKQCDICGRYYCGPEFNPNICPANQPINAFAFGHKRYDYPMSFNEELTMDICEDCKEAIEKVIETRRYINLGKGDKIYENN